MKSLLFGTAGIPLGAPNRNTVEGMPFVRKLGLECMELEFVRSINVSKENALLVKKGAENNNIVLTCHAPYFINLNSLEKDKITASIKRIVDSARRAEECGAYSVCFHPAYYQGMEKERTFQIVKKNLKEVMKQLSGTKIWVRPETTGKNSAFGDFQECIRLAEEIEGVLPCIDFAHLHARTNGKINSYEEVCELLAYYEKHLGKSALKEMHIHYAGINYTEKGEKNHLNLKQSDAKYKEVLRAWKEYKIAGCVISESPNIEEDAILMKKTYELS